MYKLRNYSEDIVNHLFDGILEKYDGICKCEKCKLDMKAVSLNLMGPNYIVTDKGELFTKAKSELNNQELINATTVITQAIEIVSKNPKHE